MSVDTRVHIDSCTLQECAAALRVLKVSASDLGYKR